MKFYGHANLQQNELQNSVIPIEERFPSTPKVGQLAFVNKILYICVDLTNGNLPVWVPLTRELTLYTHSQNTAQSMWTIKHNLNTTSVQVQVFDTSNRVIIPDEITIVDANTVTVDTHAPLSGRAIVLTGHNDGNVKPTYSFIHYQTEAATDWVINHGLGREPIVRVFVGNQEVQPLAIVHNSLNQLTVRFSEAFTGIVKLI
jgi:hypothetical protein